MQTTTTHDVFETELHRLKYNLNVLLHRGDERALLHLCDRHVKASLVKPTPFHKSSSCVDTSDEWHVRVPADAPIPDRAVDIQFHPVNLQIGTTLSPATARCTSMRDNYHPAHPVEETVIHTSRTNAPPAAMRVVGYTHPDGKAFVDMENCTTDTMIMTIQSPPFDNSSTMTEEFTWENKVNFADRVAEFSKVLLFILVSRRRNHTDYVHSVDVISGRYAEIFNATICDERGQQTLIAHAVVTPRSNARTAARRAIHTRPRGRI